jgi:L-ribulose-5-phosphate 3-epimerase UlaE
MAEWPAVGTVPNQNINNKGLSLKWVVQDTPMGEGMVDFKTYFKLLKQYKINVPVTLHMEYPLGGAENGATKLSCDKQIVFNAMKKDLQKVRALWEQE